MMNRIIRKTTWTCVGLLLALTCGTPAMADDTELLLINPDTIQQIPNVMLVIDSSGSMGNQEQTREVYDFNLLYAGGATPCDPNYYYWTEYKKVVPTCDPANTKRFLKTAFVCDAGMKQIQGIGSYRKTMAQHRDGASGIFSILLGLTDSVRWQKLEPGNETDLVECSTDSGKHGDGVNTAKLYAQRGGDQPPFTSSRRDRVNWGSWPTSQSVTIFDGNYLNYVGNAPLIMDSRINIVQNTATAILNSIEGINVGIMRFNNNDGGPVLLDLTDLDTNRASILATINGIPSGGNTPVSETVYESARYWRGLPAHYGELINENPTDPNALVSTAPEIYEQPTSKACAKNFNVVLTDGQPTSDVDPVGLVDTLPNWGTTLGYSGCTGTGGGACLDDISAYLFSDDIDLVTPGIQTVTTHTIGFAVNLPILEEAALRGGGTYFRADDVQSLTLALLEIVNDIQDRNLSFAAPAVAVNAFNRTQNLNDLYLTTFQADERIRWPGNLKKYRINNGQIVDRNAVPAVDPLTGSFYDSAASFWSTGADGNDVSAGGAVENLPVPTSRNVFTNNTSDPNLTAAANALTPSNASSFSLADFGLTGAAGEPTIDNLIRWVRGEDVGDEDLDPATTVIKQMGDPLHSQPAAVVYGGTPASPDVTVYTATNQGSVHAINAATGQELWAFMPKEHLANLPMFYINAEAPFKFYGVDGDIVPVVADRDNDGIIEPIDGDFVYILFGMRRGGDAYYLLDVTDRNNPVVKWRLSVPGFGQTWSRPTVARVDMNDPGLNNDKAVVIFGGGYDTVHDTMDHPATADAKGAGVYMADLQSGNVLWRAGPDGSADLQLPGMTRSIATQIRVIDLNGDDLADRMYASDMGGQILRFDIFSGNAPDGTGVNALVTGGVIAQLGAEGASGTPTIAETRRFYSAPDVSIFNDNAQNRRFVAVSIGSGYRAHPLDDSNTDRFYSIRDKNVFNRLTQAQFDSFTPVDDSELVEISGQTGTVIGVNQRGWKFTLPADQKVFANSVTFNNEIFFVAFSPDTTGAATCSAGAGRNFLYRVSVMNGDPITDLSTIVAGDEDKARVQDLAQGGIAPSPAFLFPSPDPSCTGDDCSPPPIGCIGVECFDPGFANFPVRTLWTQDGIE
jgi:type IV pilus assembly protein PilY1